MLVQCIESPGTVKLQLCSALLPPVLSLIWLCPVPDSLSVMCTSDPSAPCSTVQTSPSRRLPRSLRFCSCNHFLTPSSRKSQTKNRLRRDGFLVHLQGLEPWARWLRVSCSTNWARGAYFNFKMPVNPLFKPLFGSLTFALAAWATSLKLPNIRSSM